jgi:DNA polymerase-3 subunit delta'
MPVDWNLLGHQWAVDLLSKQIAEQRLRHAYLFAGPQGVGRRTLALRLAQAINCTAPPAPGAFCGECRACRGFARMQHADLLVVQRQEGDREIKVDALRELSRSLSRTPLEARYQVALLVNFDEASDEAANALLKTLEEPNPSVVLCLTALDADSLPATIVSRCELIRLRPLAREELAAGLNRQAGVSPEQANLLASISLGLPGRALQLTQDAAWLDKRNTWLAAMEDLLPASRVARFAYAEKNSKDREALRSQLLVWLSLWHDVLLRSGRSAAALANPDRAELTDRLAAKLPVDLAYKALAAVERALSLLVETNTNARLTLEVLLLDLPSL